MFDFYTYIHKSLRRQIFDVVATAGALDFTSRSELMSFAAQFERLLGNLRAHGQHEDEFLHPVLARHMPEAAERFGSAHVKQEAWLHTLEQQYQQAQAAHSVEQAAEWLRELGRFAGYYLVHLAEEEDLTVQLNATAPRQELTSAMAAFQSSRTPDEMTQDLSLMLPALNKQDQLALLGRLKETASTAFIFVMDVARRVLDERRMAALETELGVESTG